MAGYPQRYRQRDRYYTRARTSSKRRSYDPRYYSDEVFNEFDGRYYHAASKYDDGYYDQEVYEYRVGFPKNSRGTYDVGTSRRGYDYSQYNRRGYPTHTMYEDSRVYYDNSYDAGGQDYFYDEYPYDDRYYQRHEKSRSRDKHNPSSRNHKQVEVDDAPQSRLTPYRPPLPLPRDEAVVALETQHDKTEKQVIHLLQTRPVVYQFIEQEMYRIYAAVPGLTSIFENLLSEEGLQAFHSRLHTGVMKVEEIYERLCDAIRVQHRSRAVPNIFVLIQNEVYGLKLRRRVYSAEEQSVEGFRSKIATRLQAAASLLAKRHWDQWYWKADSSRIESDKTIHTLPTTQFATTKFLQDFNTNYQEVKTKWMNTIVAAWSVPVENGKIFYPTAIVWRQKFGWACEFSSDNSVKLVRLDVLTNEDRQRKKRSRHGKPQQIHFVHLLRLAKTTQVHMSPDELAQMSMGGEQKAPDSQTQHAVVRGNDFARHIRSGRDFWINSSRVTLPMCMCEMQTGVYRNMRCYSFRCCRRVYCKHHADINGFRCAYCRNYYHYTCKFNVYAKGIVRYRPGTTVCRYKDCQKRKIEDDLRDALGVDDANEDEPSSQTIIDLILLFTTGDSFVSFPCSICNDKTYVPGGCRDCDSCYLCVDGNPHHYFDCETCGNRTCTLGSFAYGKKCPSCFEDSKQ